MRTLTQPSTSCYEILDYRCTRANIRGVDLAATHPSPSRLCQFRENSSRLSLYLRLPRLVQSKVSRLVDYGSVTLEPTLREVTGLQVGEFTGYGVANSALDSSRDALGHLRMRNEKQRQSPQKAARRWEGFVQIPDCPGTYSCCNQGKWPFRLPRFVGRRMNECVLTCEGARRLDVRVRGSWWPTACRSEDVQALTR